MHFKKPTTKTKCSIANMKLYDTLFNESINFLEEHEYSIDSVDIPIRFAVQWQIPIDCNNYERQRRRDILAFDPTGAILNMPLDIFTHVYIQRYGDPYTKRGIDDMSDEEIEEKLKCDLSLKAELELFDERFCQFQTLLRHIHRMYVLKCKDKMLRFDVFDLDSYDKVFKRIDADIAEHNYPGL